MDGPRVGRPAQQIPIHRGLTWSQRNVHVAQDPRSANRNGSARPLIGGISNHKVDDSAANIDDHR